MSETLKVVFDCNVYLQALANPAGPAGRCVELALRGVVALYVSPFVLDEIRRVTSYPQLIARFKLRPSRVAVLLDNLLKVAVVVPVVAELWRYDRDPDDAHYVNLAVIAGASIVVSRDNDLLDLMDLGRPEAVEFTSKFPSLRILDPVAFLQLVMV